jgi:small conductance mechanosensitive channel
VVDEVLRANPRVLQEPAPVFGVKHLADSSVTISINPWVGVPDYVAAGAEINKAILENFRAKAIEIPFPQREVRLLGSTV